MLKTIFLSGRLSFIVGNLSHSSYLVKIQNMDSIGGSKLSGAQKEELMDQVKQQVAVLLAQELLQKITEKCFRKCISKPGTSLDNSEQKCLSLCMDRYMDSFSLVSRTYAGRLQREKGQL